MSATHILYEAAGRPEMPGDTAGQCRVCGEPGLGEPFNAWVKTTFTDHDKLSPGEIICHSCLFAFDERNEQLARLVGKDKPQRMRNYSHFVVDGRWVPLSKGDKSGMADCLRRNPDLAVIATSGQKHIIFRAQPGWWQVEEQSSLPFPDELFRLLDVVERLYTTFSKGEIAAGMYSQRRIAQFGLAEFLELERVLAPVRGTLPFELAIFLAQKREATDGDEKGSDGSERLSGGVPRGVAPADSAVARAGRRVQTEVRTKHLGTVREQHSGSGVHQQPEQVHQLTLFEATGVRDE